MVPACQHAELTERTLLCAVFGQHLFGGIAAPSMDKLLTELIRVGKRQADENRRVVEVVIRHEVNVRIGKQEEFARFEVQLQDERFTVFAQPRKKFALHFERRGSVRNTLFYVRQRSGNAANRFEILLMAFHNDYLLGAPAYLR